MYWNLWLITTLILILTLYDVNLTIAYDAFEKNLKIVVAVGIRTWKSWTWSLPLKPASSSVNWVLHYELRKAPIMYNCGNRFNDVTLRFPCIWESETSGGSQDTSFLLIYTQMQIIVWICLSLVRRQIKTSCNQIITIVPNYNNWRQILKIRDIFTLWSILFIC